jgi:hypothetical protein
MAVRLNSNLAPAKPVLKSGFPSGAINQPWADRGSLLSGRKATRLVREFLLKPTRLTLTPRHIRDRCLQLQTSAIPQNEAQAREFAKAPKERRVVATDSAAEGLRKTGPRLKNPDFPGNLTKNPVRLARTAG